MGLNTAELKASERLTPNFSVAPELLQRMLLSELLSEKGTERHVCSVEVVHEPNRSVEYPKALEARTRYAFSKLVGIEAKTDAGKELLLELEKFSADLNLKFSQIRELTSVDEKRARLLLDGLSAEQIEAGFSKVISRLRTETKLLHELEEVGIAEALAFGLEHGSYGARVKFVENTTSLCSRLRFEQGARAYYNPLTDRCVVKGPPPPAAEMWQVLLTEGGLPDQVSVLDHELTHDLQHSTIQRASMLGLMGLQTAQAVFNVHSLGPFLGLAAQLLIHPLYRRGFRALGNDKILSEIHAYEAQAANSSHLQKDLDELHEIVTQVAMLYGESPNSVRQALEAYYLVHSLRLLGSSDTELGQLVNSASYDKQEATYPKLHAALNRKRQELGLDGRDFRRLLRVLDAKLGLEKYLERGRAAKIALDEATKLNT